MAFCKQLGNRLNNTFQLFRNRQFSLFFTILRQRIYSVTEAVGLERDLEQSFPNPEAKIELAVRPLKSSDIPLFMEYGNLARESPEQARYQMSLFRSWQHACHIATDQQDIPAYMQCIITVRENEQVRAHFGNLFPKLNPGEALLEGAYMRPAFRGMRIMPAAMARIALIAREMGAKRAVTFVNIDNIPSLKGCIRAGFLPYIRRIERWVLFKHTVTYDNNVPPAILTLAGETPAPQAGVPA